MARLIEVRGGTGAGKSTLIREIRNAIAVPQDTEHLLWGYYSARRIAIPGSYRMETGGLENRYSLTRIIELLSAAAGGDVDVILFEGGLISKSTGKVYEWCVSHHDYYVVHLAIPYTRAVSQLAQRRGKPLTAEQQRLVARDHATVRSAVERIHREGHAKGVYIRHSYFEALDKVRQLIRRPI